VSGSLLRKFHFYHPHRGEGKGRRITKESIINQTDRSKISPNPPFSKRGIPPFVKGGKEGFGLECPHYYGLTNNFRHFKPF
jgi:hypothetical protein